MIATLTAIWLCVSPAITPPDDDALALLQRVAEAYQGLDHYLDRGERVVTFTIDGDRIERFDPFRLSYSRPDRFAVQAPGSRIVSDGEQMLSVVTPAGHYELTAAPDEASVEVMAVSAVGSAVLGDPIGPPLPLVLGLLTGEEPGRTIPNGPDQLTIEDDREWQGHTVRVLRVPMLGRTNWRLFLDPESFLIVGGEAIMAAESIAELSPPGLTLDEVSVSWSAGEISTAPPAEDDEDNPFLTEPPPGMARLGPLLDPEARAREEAARLAADPRVGTPAPQFTVSLLNDEGLGEEIRAVDLEGKVVLIDFWATWCGPCLKELPEVAGLIDAYAEADRADDLRILCVSIDEGGDDAQSLAKELLTFLDRNDLKLRRPPLAEVALDANGKMARAFGVRAIPSVLLIGSDGTIRAVITGFDPEFRRKMSGQIDQLLQEIKVP
ncbi:TlpA family protein disulfide reductase [Tautonia rosea]|uniref:TlpA family protein disulfide reductase n=1 Tax=Tautonia rosea TaxID=2728037 RepID=UPI0014746138|nr:TlpA disulfide reductase family protein [Tautonia rosea]